MYRVKIYIPYVSASREVMFLKMVSKTSTVLDHGFGNDFMYVSLINMGTKKVVLMLGVYSRNSGQVSVK